MRLIVEAKRVAFSAMGRVTSVNGRPAIGSSDDGLEVEAIGARSETNSRCETSKEVARVLSATGAYRVRNLLPDCDYVIKMRTASNATGLASLAERQIPARHEVHVANADLLALDFVMWSGAENVDVSVAVSYKQVSPYELDNQPSGVQFVRVKLFDTSRPESVLQTQYVPCNSIAYFNELPVSGDDDDVLVQYSVQVELLVPFSQPTSSNPHSHHHQQQQQLLLQQQSVVERSEVTFNADSAHKHVVVRLGSTANSRRTAGAEREREYQTVYFALAPALIVLLAIALNMKQVQQNLSVVRASLINAPVINALFNSRNAVGRKETSSLSNSSKSGRNKYAQQQQQQHKALAKAANARQEVASTTETSSDSDDSPAPPLIEPIPIHNSNANDYSASTEEDSDFPASAVLVKRKVKKIY